MQLETFSYQRDDGWSVDAFPNLDSERTLVVVFGGPEFIDDPAPIRELVQAYPTSSIIGCSTAGEIFATNVSDESLSVAVARFDRGSVRVAASSIESAGASYASGQALARTLDDPDLRGVIVLSDGLKVNGSELVRGLNDILPDSIVVTGGLAGDGDRFQRTWVLDNGELRQGVVSAAGLYGESIHVGHGSKGGWDLFGLERVVTRSEGHVLFELDGKPALELYKEYLGDRAQGLPATGLLFPLALRSDRTDGEQIVRTILAVDEEAQSMTFAGDVPEGALAQLMKANFDRLVDGAQGAALMTRTNANGGTNGTTPTLAIAISCVGRRLVLGERTEEEIEATADVLPKGTQQVGFYSYGELSPLADGRCDLHNQTMTLTTVSES